MVHTLLLKAVIGSLALDFFSFFSPANVAVEPEWSQDVIATSSDFYDFLTVFLTEDGCVWDISRDDAVKIKGLSNIVSVAAIYSSDAFAVDTDGMLWHWSYDQEDSSFVSEPQRVEDISDIKCVKTDRRNGTVFLITKDCEAYEYDLNENSMEKIMDNVANMENAYILINSGDIYEMLYSYDAESGVSSRTIEQIYEASEPAKKAVEIRGRMEGLYFTTEDGCSYFYDFYDSEEMHKMRNPFKIKKRFYPYGGRKALCIPV